MPALTLYDSTRPSLIPANAPAVAGYVNGEFAWSLADWARFSTPYKKTITVNAKTPADILDIERFNATSDQAPGWTSLARRAGIVRPTLYCSRLGTWPDTQKAMGKTPVDYWIADYTTSAHLVPGSVATQWTDQGDRYDLSVADQAWLAGGLPQPPPPAVLAQAIAIQPTKTGLGYWIFTVDGGVFSKGDAVFHGSAVGEIVGLAIDAQVTESGNGYWIVNTAGQVYAFGDAHYAGNAP